MNQRVEVPSKPDVCIVGAGPAGLSAAAMLGEAGRTVVLLESGDHSLSAAAQDLSDGDHEGVPYVGLADSRRRQLGGTANIWNVQVAGEAGAKYVPLSRRDLADWPVEWDEIAPYYVEAQAICGLGPFEYRAGPWSTVDRRPFDLAGTALTSGVYQFGPMTRFTRDLPARIGELGNVTLLRHTTAVGLANGSAARPAARVTAVDDDGRALTITPSALILAGGAVENARMLLLAGYGSKSFWLGRGFMEHARDFSLSMVPHSPDLFAAASFYDLHETESGHLIGGRLAVTDGALDRLNSPNASMTLFPRAGIDTSLRGRLRRAVGRSVTGRTGPYGWSAAPRNTLSFVDFKAILNLEQRPHFDNRIVLSDRTDRLGNRLPRLELTWSRDEQEQLDQLRGVVDESLNAAGIGRLKYSEGRPPDLSAHHHAGTTRMAADPRDGVVDQFGRVFQSDNLYAAGASVFPSAGFANPTLTIVAMAIRLARHVDNNLA